MSKAFPYLLSKEIFFRRLYRNFFFGIVMIGCSLFLGMCGYHYFEGMTWVDAFVDASMILSGMGPVSALHTSAGKVFAGSYALFSGIVFLVTVAIVFAPVIHWFFHKFHIQDK